MKSFVFLTCAALFAATLPGCGGAPPEGDTSHLESKEAEDLATKGRASYEGGGKEGPAAAKAGLDGGGEAESKPAE